MFSRTLLISRVLSFKFSITDVKCRGIANRKEMKMVETVPLAYASYEGTESGPTPPPLLIMHGLFGSKANWNSLSKALHKQTNPQLKIIAVDARNHGDSPHTETHTYDHLAEDIRALVEQLNIKKVSLLGHSMGGRAVMLFALKYVSKQKHLCFSAIYARLI